MGTKSEVMAKSAITDSLWTQYGSFVGQKLRNAGVSINPREDDLKKVKEWMEKTKKPAEFLLSFDGTWLTLEVRVGSNKDTMTQFNTAAENDRGKRRATLEKLSKITSVVTQADLDAFDKANPDPTELANLKKQIETKDGEIKKLEQQLKDAKAERDKLDKHFKAIGGK